jgi:hypothetical protein
MFDVSALAIDQLANAVKMAGVVPVPIATPQDSLSGYPDDWIYGFWGLGIRRCRCSNNGRNSRYCEYGRSMCTDWGWKRITMGGCFTDTAVCRAEIRMHWRNERGISWAN